MIQKRTISSIVLIAFLVVILMTGCTSQTATPTNVPLATQVVEVPTATEIVPTATIAATTEAANPDFFLTILHTNDVHSHQAANSDGDGGVALAASVINQVRASSDNTLLLSAGDTFIGTLFYVMHHGLDSAELMNALQYDAMTLGNHEFDEGDGNLALFIDELKFPVVAANVDFKKSTALKDKTVSYAIIEKGGEKIGVIGLVNPETPSLSRPGSDLVFDDGLVQVVQSNVEELTNQGVNKIIVLSHIGYAADLELAQAVTGVDVIVGGHSHTLLANYDTRAAGVYPAEVVNPEGKTVLVVQAGEYLQYIGKLDVEFNPQGELVQWSGDSIFLSHYITPDPLLSTTVATLFAPIDALTREVIGTSAIYLEGDRKVCRVEECNLGNLITDAMRAETSAQVALENGGGIRASIEQGEITLGDVLTVLPFGNLVSTLSLSGADLRSVLENGVSLMEEGGGRFLQVSGLRYQVDPTQPAGSRILSVDVLDAQGEYQPLDVNAVYTVATNDFLREGGDGFTVMAEKALDAYDYGRPLDEVLADYLKANNPVSTDIEGRITIK
jgi:5'-nucleotidase / UDP-sugar diphosphatase